MPTDGVKREVEEKTGIQIQPERLTGLYYWLLGNQSYLILTFLCSPKGGQLQRSEESLEVAYNPRFSLPRFMLPIHWHPIKEGLEGNPKAVLGVRQEPSRGLKIARHTLMSVIHRWTNYHRQRNGLPSYEKPRAWQCGAYALLKDAHGRVLWVTRTKHDVWNLPCGRSENGEAPWETAVRETREETGLTVELNQLTGIYVKKADNSMIFTFLGRIEAGTLTLGDEVADFAYFGVGSEPTNSLPKQVEWVWDAGSSNPFPVIRHLTGPSGLKLLTLE